MAERKIVARERVEQSSGIYRVIAGYRHDQAVAAAYAGALCIGRCEAAQVEEAIAAIEEVLKERRAAFVAARESECVSAGEMRDLLATLTAPRRQRLFPMLRCHARFPGAIATAEILARRLNSSADQVWKEYVWLGRKIGTALGVPLRIADRAELPNIYPILAFAELSRSVVARSWEITLRPSALEVITDLQAEHPFLVSSDEFFRRVG
jgi:hypothetical protein